MSIIEVIPFLLAGLVTALLVGMLTVATVTDMKSRKIPNRLTYSACLIALVLNLLASFLGTQTVATITLFERTVNIPGTIGIGSSLLGAVGCLIVMLVLYDVAGSGGGDLKLATALGACLGLQSGLLVILWCHLLAGFVLIIWAVVQTGPVKIGTLLVRSTAAIFLPGLIRPPAKAESEILRTPIPLAGFFAAAVCLTISGVHFS